MSSVILNATCSFFDVKNIQESRLPSKTGAVRFLAVSALVASVFASALIPAVICTGVIAATTAAIMLKNRKVEQLNESEVVNEFKKEIDNSSKEKKYALLTVCLSFLTKEIEKMPETIGVTKKFLFFSWKSSKGTEEHILKKINKYLKNSSNELVQEKSKNGISIKVEGDQIKIEKLSIISTLRIIEHLYTQLGKSHKAKDITDFINQIQPDTENSINQATE